MIKDAIGKVRSYLSNLANWEKSGKKQGKPGLPGARDHPTLYQGTCSLERAEGKRHFVRLKVYDGRVWQWVNYPVVYSRYFEQRRCEEAWQHKSPILVLRPHSAEVHFPQTKEIAAKKVRESKLDPDLVTVAVDLNVKNLAVITVRQHEHIIETVFVSKAARSIATVCARYPGCVLLFERLRKMKARGASKSRRMNRRQANQLRGKINQCSRENVFAQGMCTVEVNPHGTSQYCSRCGHVGERFSYHQGQRIHVKWGNLFWCPHCHYEVNADWNGSVNVHHSFFHELHWQPRGIRSG